MLELARSKSPFEASAPTNYLECPADSRETTARDAICEHFVGQDQRGP
jgi:hypothetical protein